MIPSWSLVLTEVTTPSNADLVSTSLSPVTGITSRLTVGATVQDDRDISLEKDTPTGKDTSELEAPSLFTE